MSKNVKKNKTGMKEKLVIQVKPFHRKIKVLIPPELITLMLMMDKLIPNDEWMVLTTVKEFREGEILLDTEYTIPEQEVSGGSVEPKEFPVGYEVAIHRHPSGVKSFSGTDWEYLNQNYPISLLWVDSHFETGVMQVETPAGFTWIELDVEMMILDELKETVSKKIHKKTYISKSSKSFKNKNSYYETYHTLSKYPDFYEETQDSLYDKAAMIMTELVAKDPDMSVYEIQAELEKRGIPLTTTEIERMLFGYY